jgi:hypothetical protein
VASQEGLSSHDHHALPSSSLCEYQVAVAAERAQLNRTKIKNVKKKRKKNR